MGAALLIALVVLLVFVLLYALASLGVRYIDLRDERDDLRCRVVEIEAELHDLRRRDRVVSRVTAEGEPSWN